MINFKVLKCKNVSCNSWVVLLHGLGGSSQIWYKQFDVLKRHYNIVIVDFYGHGDTKLTLPEYDFHSVAKSIIDVLDYLNIDKAHFMGISLGSIVGIAIGHYFPERVKSLVLGGAVLKFRNTTTFLLYLSYVLKNILPYMWLYKIFAWIIMPKKNHKRSRQIFVREAKKLGRKEFLKWHKLLAKYKEVCENYSKSIFNSIPKCFITGEEDHLFVKDIIDYGKKDPLSMVYIIKKCGHVCNVEKAHEFNKVSLKFLEVMEKSHLQQAQALTEELNSIYSCAVNFF